MDSDTAQQSPIDIPATSPGPLTRSAPVELALKQAYWRVFNNGHTVEAVPTTAAGGLGAGAAGAVSIAGKNYMILQLHFHAPSEHTVGGKHFPLEMHVVARSADGSTTVLGALMQIGDSNAGLQQIFDAMPSKVGEADTGVLLKSRFDLGAVLPRSADAVRYQGSLTTPPCTAGVLWDLYRQPIEISATEAKGFTSIYRNDSRPTQPLHGRGLSVHEVTIKQ